jgi:hypothetical protein
MVWAVLFGWLVAGGGGAFLGLVMLGSTPALGKAYITKCKVSFTCGGLHKWQP